MFGFRFSARVHAALASGALTLAGCFSDMGLQGATSGPQTDEPTTSGTSTTSTGTTDDAPATTGPATTGGTSGDPPELTTWPGDPVSKPGPPELVSVELDDETLRLTFTEPMGPVGAVAPAQFRLSAAIFVPEEKVTVYYDPSPWNVACIDIATGMPDCYEEPLTVYEIDDSLDPNELDVDLAYEVVAATCAELATRAIALGGTGALYLHYTDDGAGQVTDVDGEALVGFGESWVSSGEPTRMVAGEFPELVPLLPIPCVPG
jgi:hypothetical protein